MKKITVLSAAATLTLGAALVVGMNSPASARWELVQIDQQTDTVYRAETAGRSGNVKACYESEVIITTSQWTHSQTGRTRGIVETTDVIDEVQVDNSLCGGR